MRKHDPITLYARRGVVLLGVAIGLSTGGYLFCKGVALLGSIFWSVVSWYFSTGLLALPVLMVEAE